MNCLETIELRSIEGDRERLESQLLKLISEVNLDGKKQAIKAYSHETINSDFCIQLLHDSRKADAGGSQLGLHLVSELKAFGLINHSIWVEMRG
jgi:hypothetical protein